MLFRWAHLWGRALARLTTHRFTKVGSCGRRRARRKSTAPTTQLRDDINWVSSMIEFSDLTLLDYFDSYLQTSLSARPFAEYLYAIERNLSGAREIKKRLHILTQMLHARAHESQMANKLDEAAIVRRCLDHQVYTPTVADGALQDSKNPNTSSRHPLSTSSPRNQTRTDESLRDYYDKVGDSVSALSISRDLYLRNWSMPFDGTGVLREQLEKRYQTFRDRVHKYCPSLDILAELSTLFHFARGLQCARDDPVAIPRDWHSRLCKPRSPPIYGFSAFYLAVDFDLPNLLAALFRDGLLAQISLSKILGWTLLGVPSRLGKYKAACWLIDKGTDVNARDEFGDTPLHNACQGGRIQLVNLLISNGADVNAVNHKPQTPLHKVVVEVLHGKGSSLWRNIGRSLLESGAKPELIDQDDNNALHLAAQAGDLDLVRMLSPRLSQLKSLEACGQLSYTPLHFAIEKGHTQVAIFLIKQDHKVNVCTSFGRSPLHFISYPPWSPDIRMMMGFLIEHGAEIDQKDHSSNTPLHLAAIGGKVEAVKALLENGADKEKLNSSDHTPSQLAFWEGHSAVCSLLNEGPSSVTGG